MNQHLKKFANSNDSIKIEQDGDKTIVKNPWNDPSVIFEFEKGQVLKPLRNITLPKELIAILHDDNKLEFIYGPLSEDDNERGREFEFNFSGEKFTCHFSHCSKAIEILAKSFTEGEMESASRYRNLRYLKDYLLGGDFFSEYFKNPIPISFFVEGNFSEIGSDFVEFSKHLNFYLRYFDRKSSQIHILKVADYEEDDFKIEPTLFDEFPQTVTAQKIDSTLLDIFEVAEETSSPRLKFIFYFQIIEYCSYYYLREDLKTNIFKILKNPGISNNPNRFSKVIIEEFKDHFKHRDDSAKLEKIILDYCGIDDIKNELSTNWEYFSKDIEFDGGLKIPKIIKDEDSVEKLVHEDLIKIKNNIERIRNVLVHLRESRENKVILPTSRNNYLLRPYLHIIHRLAENIAIHFD